MKKIVSLTLALLMVFSVLTTQAFAANDDGKIHLEFWHSMGSKTGTCNNSGNMGSMTIIIIRHLLFAYIITKSTDSLSKINMCSNPCIHHSYSDIISNIS